MQTSQLDSGTASVNHRSRYAGDTVPNLYQTKFVLNATSTGTFKVWWFGDADAVDATATVKAGSYIAYQKLN